MVLFLFPNKWGKIVVGILGSLLFYAWGNANYLPLMAGVILGNYFLGYGIDYFRNRKPGQVFLWVGILINIGVLFGFKVVDVKYPLGLSYIIFQVVAYLLEIHHRKVAVEKNILYFSFYILLFPKILVGPITRYSSLAKDIRELKPTALDVADGIRRFMQGVSKKVLIADTLATVVNPIFSLKSPVVSPWIAWLVLICYALQLYFDFSGYTDMAIGLGKIMGLKFVENFNYPYISKTIGEFWRRWHISLSSWFRDFVFYPLERKRLKWTGQPGNILIVFALTGLWHGVSWNYVLWGLLHGFALVFEASASGRKLRSASVIIQRVYALGVILAGWVLFRSPSLKFAAQFFMRLAGYGAGLQPLPFQLTRPLPIVEPTLVMAIVMGILLSLPVASWLSKNIQKISNQKPFMQFAIQVTGDIALIAFFVFSIAAVTSRNSLPGIYGSF